MGRWRDGQKANALLSQKNGRRLTAGQKGTSYGHPGTGRFVDSAEYQKKLEELKAKKTAVQKDKTAE